MSRWVLLVVALLLAACGGSTDPTAAGRSPGDDDAPTDRTAGAYTGTLGGDAQLEGGCAWLDTADEGRVEPRWPDGYRIAFEPVRLLGPDGEVVAQEGDELTVRGAIDGEIMTICQVGPVLTVTGIVEAEGS